MPRKAKIGSVLIVEDEALIALEMRETLEAAGAAGVAVVSTTVDALECLKHDRPDVLILDVHLADRSDGWSVAELVSLLGPKLPRIVFATATPQQIPPEIAKLGRVLEKPVSPAELVDAVTRRKEEGLLAALRR